MNRVSTQGSYQTALLNLYAAQSRMQDAQNRIGTEKVATDLEGFGRSSETLTALKSSQARIQRFIDTGETVQARLVTQDLGLLQIGSGIEVAREAIANGLAAGRVEGVMQAFEDAFQTAQSGLNMQHQGRYVFAGGNVEIAPVGVDTLAELAAAPSVDAAFTDDGLKSPSRLDEGTSLDTGFLASELGADVFQIMRDVQQYQNGTAVTITEPGPPPVTTTYTPDADPSRRISGQPSEDVKTFLSAQLARLDRALVKVTDETARNGNMQNRVDAILTSQEQQKLSLTELVGSKTDADLAQAAVDLKLSEVAIQASAQVINTLRQTSLLNFLN